MNNKIGIFFLILVFLAIFLPFASNLPDGLEKVVENFGVKEQNNFWNGLMANYLIESINSPIISTFIAGTIGTFTVLVAALILGRTIQPDKPK